MHFKKKITVEELAGTCTSSSTIHGYLDEVIVLKSCHPVLSCIAPSKLICQSPQPHAASNKVVKGDSIVG